MWTVSIFLVHVNDVCAFWMIGVGPVWWKSFPAGLWFQCTLRVVQGPIVLLMCLHWDVTFPAEAVACTCFIWTLTMCLRRRKETCCYLITKICPPPPPIELFTWLQAFYHRLDEVTAFSCLLPVSGRCGETDLERPTGWILHQRLLHPLHGWSTTPRPHVRADVCSALISLLLFRSVFSLAWPFPQSSGSSSTASRCPPWWRWAPTRRPNPTCG